MARPKKAASVGQISNEISAALRRTSLRPTIRGYTPQEHQVKFHSSESKGRLFIGGNRCLAKGTEVLLADGTTQKIENIQVGDLVLGKNKLGLFEPTPVLDVFNNGSKPCRELIFGRYSDTVSVTCTDSHKFVGSYVSHGKRFPTVADFSRFTTKDSKVHRFRSNSDASMLALKSWNSVGEMPTYDLSIGNETNIYLLANGLQTHNSGKTVGGGTEAVFWLTGQHPYWQKFQPPVRGRIVAVDFDNGVEKIVLPEIAKWMPPSYLLKGSWEESYHKSLRTLTLTNGSTVEFMSYDQDTDKFAGTSRHFCVDTETEVLTQEGWKTHTEITLGMPILTYNKGKYEWKPIELIYSANVKENLVRIQGREVDALVTKDHNWVTQNRKTKVRTLKSTLDLTTNDSLVLGAEAVPTGFGVDKNYAYLLGLYIAEGNKPNGNWNQCNIAQVKPEIRAKIARAIETLGLECNVYERQYYFPTDPFTAHVTYKKSDRCKAMAKHPSYEVLKWDIASRYALFTGLMEGDGNKRVGGSYRYTTVDRFIFDWVIALGVSLGYKINTAIDDAYRVYFKSEDSERYDYNLTNVASLTRSEEYYEGIVWCPGTPNKTAVFRRNGKVYLSGQCWFDEEPPKHIFDECMMRLVDTGGNWWVTMTPVEDMTWSYDGLYMPATEGKRPDVQVFEVSSEENQYISVAELELLTLGLSDEDRQARLHGKYIRHSGTIYGEHIRDTSYIADIVDTESWENYRTRWTHFVAMDHGFTNPTCFLFMCSDAQGRVVVYDEYYMNKRIVRDNAQAVLEMEETLGIQPVYRVGDPSIVQTNPITGTNVQIEYMENGVAIVAGNNDVRAGIDRVSSRFKYNQLFITDRCVNLKWELNRYRWARHTSKKVAERSNLKEVPLKKDDHAVDALRYGLVSRPPMPGEKDIAGFDVDLISHSNAIASDGSRLDLELTNLIQEEEVYNDNLGSYW